MRMKPGPESETACSRSLPQQWIWAISGPPKYVKSWPKTLKSHYSTYFRGLGRTLSSILLLAHWQPEIVGYGQTFESKRSGRESVSARRCLAHNPGP